METLTNCPICNSSSFTPFLECTDYTVSKNKFTIVQCSCGFRFTNPRPEEKEAGKYYQSEDYISHSNTKKGLVNSLYQVARKFTLRSKLKLVSNTVGALHESPLLLDLGCGTGEFLNTCKENGWNVQGIEPSPEARTFATKQYGLTVHETDKWEQLSDATFNVVSAWHVLEHVYKLEETVKQVKRILKPDGTCIVALPNCNSADAGFYKQYWAAYDVPRHIWHFTPADVKRFFQKQGFSLKETLPMKLDAYYICMLSEKYKGGNTNYGRAAIHGWASNRQAAKTGLAFSSQVYILKPVR
ncbi:MAG: class I SAM-dependent methyltransferase [Bacteroidia bacterium]